MPTENMPLLALLPWFSGHMVVVNGYQANIFLLF